nr:arabinogalactan peptide 14 [Tanacetum cinerariifolium]
MESMKKMFVMLVVMMMAVSSVTAAHAPAPAPAPTADASSTALASVAFGCWIGFGGVWFAKRVARNPSLLMGLEIATL